MGIYLSAHPLDEYSVILKHVCNTRCKEIEENRELLKDRSELTFGGIVTHVREGFTKKNTPYGSVTIEDFDGSGSLALFGEDWGMWKGYFVTGSSVYVTGKCVPRFRDANIYDIRVSSVQYLQNVQGNTIAKVIIKMDTGNVDEQTIDELSTLVNENPGDTQLYFQVHDVEADYTYLLKSKQSKIKLTKHFMDYLEQSPTLDYNIN